MKLLHTPTAEQAARIALVRTIADTCTVNSDGRPSRAIIYGICNAISVATRLGRADAALAAKLQHAVDRTVNEADMAYLPSALFGPSWRLPPPVACALRLALRLMWLAHWANTGVGLLGGNEWVLAAPQAQRYALELFPNDAGVINAYTG